jgi:hypothetical protein
MTATKTVGTTTRKTTAENSPAAQTTPSTRRPWIKKTPVEVVLDQIRKQEEKVSELREDLTREERELSKLQQAKKILEST